MDADRARPCPRPIPRTKIDIHAGIRSPAPVISLRREGRRALNARMKMKLLLSLAVIGSFALSAAFAQTAAPKLEMTGKVVAITADVITVRKANDAKFVWEIKMGLWDGHSRNRQAGSRRDCDGELH